MLVFKEGLRDSRTRYGFRNETVGAENIFIKEPCFIMLLPIQNFPNAYWTLLKKSYPNLCKYLNIFCNWYVHIYECINICVYIFTCTYIYACTSPLLSCGQACFLTSTHEKTWFIFTSDSSHW